MWHTQRLAGEGDVVKKPKARLDAWAEAHKRFHLSDLPIQMARELGLNPKKSGGLADIGRSPRRLDPLALGRHRARCLTVRLPMVAIGRALQPFPRSKRSRHVSAHSAFPLGLSTLEERIRRCRRRGAPASEDCHLPSSLPPLASLLTGLP